MSRERYKIMRSQLLGFFFHLCVCFHLTAAIESPNVVRAAIDIGVGSVFGYGIHGMVGGKNQFSIDDLASVVHKLPGKTDDDLGGGDYAFVEGSNTIFVLGFMQNLRIYKIHIINVNNADGAMIYEPFWKGAKRGHDG